MKGQIVQLERNKTVAEIKMIIGEMFNLTAGSFKFTYWREEVFMDDSKIVVTFSDRK